MKKIIVALLVIFTVFIISGCSQKKIAQPLDPSSLSGRADKKTGDMEGISVTDAKKDYASESITEKQLSKIEPSDMKSYIRELQTKIKDIYFDFDSYDIRDDARPVLKEVASILTKNKDIKVIIEGHADEKGTNEYNLGLGDRRANSAKEHLISLGIPSARINTISYGEEKPLCSEQTDECWAKNRRAHFVLIEGR